MYLNGWGWVSNIVKKVHQVNKPANTLKFLDDADPRGTNMGSFVAGYNSNWVDWPAYNHGLKLINLSYFDGHVKTYTIQDESTSQINWFWSREGLNDRLKFIEYSNPDR